MVLIRYTLLGMIRYSSIFANPFYLLQLVAKFQVLGLCLTSYQNFSQEYRMMKKKDFSWPNHFFQALSSPLWSYPISLPNLSKMLCISRQCTKDQRTLMVIFSSSNRVRQAQPAISRAALIIQYPSFGKTWPKFGSLWTFSPINLAKNKEL